MADEEFVRLFLEMKEKNDESMERITTYTANINRRIKRILGAL